VFLHIKSSLLFSIIPIKKKKEKEKEKDFFYKQKNVLINSFPHDFCPSMSNSFNDYVFDHVFLDFIMAYTTTCAEVKFRRWNGPVGLEKVVKGNEIACAQNFVFIAAREQLDREAQNFVYQYARDSNLNFATRKYWNVVIVAPMFCVLSSNNKSHGERPLQYREFISILNVLMKIRDLEPPNIQTIHDTRCWTCLQTKQAVYSCVQCYTLFCKECLHEMGTRKSMQERLKVECCVCNQEIEVEESTSDSSSFAVRIDSKNILFLKEGALYHILKLVEGIEFSPDVMYPKFNRPNFLEEIKNKVPFHVLEKYVDMSNN